MMIFFVFLFCFWKRPFETIQVKSSDDDGNLIEFYPHHTHTNTLNLKISS